MRERERSDLYRILIIAPVEREALADIANVYNYQTFAETDKAGYIIRQWLASNLYDRIKFVVERQFLCCNVDKLYSQFSTFPKYCGEKVDGVSILNGLRDARNRKIFHGDIKSENILVTSWNWIYLTDFASYKPTYLLLDDPAD